MAKKVTAKSQIKEGAALLKEAMIEQLSYIAENIIDQIMVIHRNEQPSKRLLAAQSVTPKGQKEYKALIIELMAELSRDAIEQSKKEVPAKKKHKFTEFEKLPAGLQKKIKARADLLVGKQIGDLMATIQFAYANNEDTTDSDDTVEQEISDSALGWLDGTSLSAGADISAATIISDAREAFFFEPEVLEEIDAFEFVNEDPVTPICQDLAGTIFSKDDPDMFKYTPPLHWNCKSWIRPILKGNLGNKEITKLKPSTKKLEDSIQFSEEAETFCACNHKK